MIGDSQLNQADADLAQTSDSKLIAQICGSDCAALARASPDGPSFILTEEAERNYSRLKRSLSKRVALIEFV